MSQSLITALLACIVVTAIVVLLSRLERPHYRRSRDEVLAFLRDTEAGGVSAEAWVIFIGLPMRHDPHLEWARHACLEMDDDPALVKRREKAGRLVLTEAGRRRCREIIDEIERSASGTV